MKKKLVAMLLTAVLLTAVAVPAMADTYLVRQCPMCGTLGYWQRCGILLGRPSEFHTYGNGQQCLVITTYYTTVIDCDSSSCEADASRKHAHRVTHDSCSLGVIDTCNV